MSNIVALLTGQAFLTVISLLLVALIIFNFKDVANFIGTRLKLASNYVKDSFGRELSKAEVKTVEELILDIKNSTSDVPEINTKEFHKLAAAKKLKVPVNNQSIKSLRKPIGSM